MSRLHRSAAGGDTRAGGESGNGYDSPVAFRWKRRAMRQWSRNEPVTFHRASLDRPCLAPYRSATTFRLELAHPVKAGAAKLRVLASSALPLRPKDLKTAELPSGGSALA